MSQVCTSAAAQSEGSNHPFLQMQFIPATLVQAACDSLLAVLAQCNLFLWLNQHAYAQLQERQASRLEYFGIHCKYIIGTAAAVLHSSSLRLNMEHPTNSVRDFIEAFCKLAFALSMAIQSCPASYALPFLHVQVLQIQTLFSISWCTIRAAG